MGGVGIQSKAPCFLALCSEAAADCAAHWCPKVLPPHQFYILIILKKNTSLLFSPKFHCEYLYYQMFSFCFTIMNGGTVVLANSIMPRVVSPRHRDRRIYQIKTDLKVLMKNRHCRQKHSGQNPTHEKGWCGSFKRACLVSHPCCVASEQRWGGSSLSWVANLIWHLCLLGVRRQEPLRMRPWSKVFWVTVSGTKPWWSNHYQGSKSPL